MESKCSRLATTFTPDQLGTPLLTIPLLLLGLYAGLLATAIAIGSWAGHANPAPEEARRVTDAAERAGLGQLLYPAKLAAGVVAVAAISISALLQTNGGNFFWTIGGAVVPPLAIGSAVFYFSKKILRASGQLVGSDSRDARISITGRTLLAGVLCCETTVGLTLLGLHTLVASELGSQGASQLVLVASSTTALAAVVFARAASASIVSAGEGSAGHGPEPHTASLALLVNKSFHGPLLHILNLVVLSSLGHAVLLLLTSAGSTGLEEIWLYPHLLKLLGLFVLLFSQYSVRSAETETSSPAWMRGAAVHLVLMIAGAWSLSARLKDDWSTTLPAGLTFLFLAFGIASSLSVSEPLRTRDQHPIGLKRLPSISIALFAFLALAVLSSLDEELSLPASVSGGALVAGSLSLVPLATSWRLARDISIGGFSAHALAYGGLSTTPAPDVTSPRPFWTILSLLGLGVIFGSWSVPKIEAQLSQAIPFLGVGLSTGALATAALLAFTLRGCNPSIETIRGLLSKGVPTADDLNFEAAVVACRGAVEYKGIATIGIALTPVAVAIAIHQLVGTQNFQAFAVGIALGAVLIGTGWDLFAADEHRLERRTAGTLCSIAGTTQSLWLLAAVVLIQ